MRFHLFEFEDFPWFPSAIREGGTDFLRYFLIHSKLYEPVVPLISQALERTGETTLVDLCSGGGGVIEQIAGDLKLNSDKNIQIILTDKFPGLETYEYLKSKSQGQINYLADSVDASSVPDNVKGLRTMFSAIHHFKPQGVKAILKDATEKRQPIAIFDGGDKGIFVMLGMLIFHPLAFLIFTPFFKPFRWSRLFFTYIIPLIPLYTVWDGCVSVLRLYKPKELAEMARETEADNYAWISGKVKNKLGIHAVYLIGYPREKIIE